MASRRRNIKTHPDAEDPDAGGFVSPERTDLTLQSAEEPVVIDLRAGSEEVNLNPGDGKETQGQGTRETTLQGDAPAARPQRAERTEQQQREANDDQGEQYSRRVRGRISRERNLLNRERTLREQTQRQLGEERAARVAQDERIARLERAQTSIAGNADVKSLQTKISKIGEQLVAAKEAGDTKLEMELTIKLGDAQGDLKVLQFKLQQDAAAADAAETARRAQAGTHTDTGADPLTAEERAAAGDWQKQNRHWFSRPSFRNAKADAIAIDGEIMADIRTGELDCDLYSDEHFEELARRLKAAHPDLPVVDLEGQDYDFTDDEDEDMRDDERSSRRDSRDDRGDRRNGGRQLNARGERVNGNRNGTGGRSPAGGIGQGGRRQVTPVDLARQGKVSLDQADFNTMRIFGMDPNKPEDKKAFAKERMRTILTEDARGTR